MSYLSCVLHLKSDNILANKPLTLITDSLFLGYFAVLISIDASLIKERLDVAKVIYS